MPMPPPNCQRQLFAFGWPSNLGGADTKLVHLLELLHEYCEITVVPNEERHLHNKAWTRYLDRLGVRYALLEKLPRRLGGVGLAMSNQCFFTRNIAQRAKERGLRVVWSSEMMWHHKGELEAIQAGIIDKVLYTSEFQKAALSPGYGGLPSAITGNYIRASHFPFKPRRNAVLTIGRLSRADPLKYPEDFPVFYESLSLPEVRFRVMAWDERLTRKYRWHHFDRRWDLLPAEREPAVEFLQSLDLFVYPLGHKFRESWGRSTVEAMLTGAIPIVPRGHQFEKLLIHGKSGFICNDFLEFKDCCHSLFFDLGLRQTMAAESRRHAEEVLCNAAEHRAVWLKALFDVKAEPGQASPENRPHETLLP